MISNSQYRILLLEDDQQLAKLIVRFLNERGCATVHVERGSEFTSALEQGPYDIVIADIILPDASGLQLLRDQRNQINCPLIFLSALSAIEDQIAGLELGACDYLVKPVDPNLLWAKIEVHLRHRLAPVSVARNISFGPLQLDLTSRAAKVHDTPLPLTSNEFDLLLIFAEQPAQLLTREYLFRRIMGREFDGLDRAVDMRVSRLRKKLDSIAGGVTIRSARGRGYSLNQAGGDL